MYFFDLDGTLLDSNGIWLDIDIEFLGRRGISPVPQDYTDYVTHHSAPDAARYTRERFSLPETPEEIMDVHGPLRLCSHSAPEARRARLSGRLPPPGDTDGGAHLLHASPVPRRPGAPPPSGLL